MIDRWSEADWCLLRHEKTDMSKHGNTSTLWTHGRARKGSWAETYDRGSGKACMACKKMGALRLAILHGGPKLIILRLPNATNNQ